MEGRVVTVRGIVQGVGFRPFVYGLASRLNLSGSIRNQTGSVRIDIEGEPAALDCFLDELVGHPPPLARIDHISWEAGAVSGGGEFQIGPSQADASPIFISPDVASCGACLGELFDRADRRWRYPFLNCIHCGPRLTIITGAPYDRLKTTMAEFGLCRACRAEYNDPGDRRFHAQATACPHCGPRLEALGAAGERIESSDPLALFVQAVQSGGIGALKGLGGYHLVCDARSAAAVAELRRRKQRDEKPMAVMVRDLAAAVALCEASEGERELLSSPRRPIVLLRKRRGAAIAGEVAPGNPHLGVMLPYTPLHHLLLRDTGGVPLVMTSGNRSDEPIAHEDHDAIRRLHGIADMFLMHNRPIRVRCDDSVTRVVDGAELPVRRSRGYAPAPIPLPFACAAATLAVGGQFNAAFALGRERHAIVSHHLGDLDHYSAFRAFERDVALYEELFAIEPQRIVHDLHPDYASTRYAAERGARGGAEVFAVQHHHAHMASCMAEHGLCEPVIGVSFDGTGYGTDGAIWGGEFLAGDYRQFRRAAHLRYVGMPGGEQAVRQPWRMAVAHLADAGAELKSLTGRLSPAALRTVRSMLGRRLNTPPTSSAGRLFDAVAALVGLRDCVSYQGQAAMELEWLASRAAADGVYPLDFAEEATDKTSSPTLVLDTRPIIREVVNDIKSGIESRVVARRFHSTMVDAIVAVCGRIRGASGLEAVTLSGGVFMNAILTRETAERLREEGFRVYRHRLVPPNDGGLSLGQLAVAAACCEA